MRIRAALVTLLGLCFVLSAHAEESIAPGKFLGEEGQWILDMSAVYSNSENSTVKSGDYAVVQTGTGQYVKVPSTVSNTDTLMLFPSASYALTDGTGIGANLAASSVWARTDMADGPQSTSVTQFLGVSLNASHTFSKSRKTLIPVLFLDASLAENVAAKGAQFVYGKSFNAGAVFYRQIDPVILSATAFYQFNRPRSVGEKTYTPGNLLVLNPTAYFKANMLIAKSPPCNFAAFDPLRGLP